MLLSELRSYPGQRNRASMGGMAIRFEVDAQALRGILAILERKGRVGKLAWVSGCDGGCGKCDRATLEFCEWVDD